MTSNPIFDDIKKAYTKEIIEEIKKYYPRSICPYLIFNNWVDIFTPIERNAWAAIRYLSLPVFPQFPIDKYFVDFADIVKKYVFEIDGHEFHSTIEQRKRDKIRSDKLKSLGWIIYRINGRDTFDYEINEIIDEEGEFIYIDEQITMNKFEKLLLDCYRGILI